MGNIQKFYSFSAKGKSKFAEGKSITFELISEQEPFEYKFTEDECEDRKNTIHDSYLDIYKISLNDEQANSIVKSLPVDIVEEAVQWGWSDTVVGDKVYLFLNAYPDILEWRDDK
ncbi:hypothetical protein [Priestia megaterium]|uniref:hypothetical protein n=1 Tax=Priestia megaterium TaxID=1404 RepID=UPI0028775B5D|nr:hypothetical protein [Priestia megaterium]